MKNSNSIRSFFALFHTGLFCLIMVSNMLFMHSHTTRNGTVVIHVHPYKLGSDGLVKKHQHTEKELYMLDYIHQGTFLVTFSFHLPVQLFSAIETPCPAFPFSELVTTRTATPLLRGPPCGIS